MPSLQKINLGTPPQGRDGDSARVGSVKFNANVDVLGAQVALTSAPLITASQTLTADHIGKRISISFAVAGGVIKMKRASTCVPDSMVWLVNVGAKPFALGSDDSSGDSIAIGVLNPGEAVILDTDGVHTWRVLLRGRTWTGDEAVSGKLTVATDLSVGGSATFGGGATFGAGSKFPDRPAFAGNTPWDSANFDPSKYARLDGAVFSGRVMLGPLVNQSYSNHLYFGATGYAPFMRSNNATKTIETINAANTLVTSSISDYGDLYIARRISVGNQENVPKFELRGFGDFRGYGMWMQASAYSATPITFVNPDGYVCGSISMSANAVAYTSASDYRIKDVDRLFDAALDVIRSVPVWEYRLKNNPERGTIVGFVAHELQSVVPHAVYGEKDAIAGYVPVYRDGYVPAADCGAPNPEDVIGVEEIPALQTVDKTELVPYLWAAVQQLAARVDALELSAGNQPAARTEAP